MMQAMSALPMPEHPITKLHHVDGHAGMQDCYVLGQKTQQA